MDNNTPTIASAWVTDFYSQVFYNDPDVWKKLPPDAEKTASFLIGELPEREALIMSMYYIDGETQAEIGKCIKLSASAARTIIAKETNKIRRSQRSTQMLLLGLGEYKKEIERYNNSEESKAAIEALRDEITQADSEIVSLRVQLLKKKNKISDLRRNLSNANAIAEEYNRTRKEIFEKLDLMLSDTQSAFRTCVDMAAPEEVTEDDRVWLERLDLRDVSFEGMPSRLRWCAHDLHVNSYEELVDIPVEDIAKARNIGSQSLKLLAQLLYVNGYLDKANEIALYVSSHY